MPIQETLATSRSAIGIGAVAVIAVVVISLVRIPQHDDCIDQGGYHDGWWEEPSPDKADKPKPPYAYSWDQPAATEKK